MDLSPRRWDHNAKAFSPAGGVRQHPSLPTPVKKLLAGLGEITGSLTPERGRRQREHSERLTSSLQITPLGLLPWGPALSDCPPRTSMQFIQTLYAAAGHSGSAPHLRVRMGDGSGEWVRNKKYLGSCSHAGVPSPPPCPQGSPLQVTRSGGQELTGFLGGRDWARAAPNQSPLCCCAIGRWLCRGGGGGL